MSFNLFLIQFVFFACVFMLFQATRMPRGWLFVAVLVLGILSVSYVLVPSEAGWISAVAWVLLVLVPLMGYARINHLVAQERYSSAYRLAWILRWLHPADGLLEYPDILKAQALAQKGDLEMARQIFKRYQSSTTPMGRMATVLLYRLDANWDDLLRWLTIHVSPRQLFKDAGLAALYARSLGETGDLNGLLQAVDQFEQRFGRTGSHTSLNLVRLYALAFCGQTAQVQTLLERALSIYPDRTRQFWMATAEMAAGHTAIAREHLLALRNHSDAMQRTAIDWRLSHACARPEVTLTDCSRQILAQIEVTMQQEARYGSRAFLRAKTRPYATYTLIAANLLVFALETIAGGSEDLVVLYRLGALVPGNVLAGEWWRILNALFLHAGILHLTANMVGLYFFGMLVESALGSRKFLLGYFFSGIGSMLVVTALALHANLLDQITVGASGAIMGLLGIEAAILLKGWQQEKAKVAAERFRLILTVAVLQFISDVLNPQVSLVGHTSGLLLGFAVGWMLFKPGEGGSKGQRESPFSSLP